MTFGTEAEFAERLRGFKPAPPAQLQRPIDSRTAEFIAVPEANQRETIPAMRRGRPPAHTKNEAQSKVPFRGVFPGAYFQMPNRLFGSGLAAKLKGSAGWTYTALCDHANRNSKGTFKVSDMALASDTGLSPRSILEARKKLLNFGLIECSVLPGRSAVYTLKNPPLEWSPVKNRPRSKCKPRGKSAPKPTREKEGDLYDLPQILHGTCANFARPYKCS